MIYFQIFFVVGKVVKEEALQRHGYQLQNRMLSSFIPGPLVKRISRMGKSVNFLFVYCCRSGLGICSY